VEKAANPVTLQIGERLYNFLMIAASKPGAPSASSKRAARRRARAAGLLSAASAEMAAFESELRKEDGWPKAVAVVIGLLIVAFALSSVTYRADSRIFFAMWVVISILAVGYLMTRDSAATHHHIEQ
jgi:hypothetical protein